MPLAARLGLTGLVILLAAFFCTVGRTSFRCLGRNPGYSAGGRYNPIRWLLFDDDRILSRVGILAF